MTTDRIVTVTLNPAIDKVLIAPGFKVGEHARATVDCEYPAGKGINVSRSLGILGTNSIATGFIGKEELTDFENHLERVAQGRVIMQLLVVSGRTRENISVMDPLLDTETHIRTEGFRVERDDVSRIISKVGMLARPGAIIVFSGSLPHGLSLGDLRSLVHRCIDADAQVVVDMGERAGEALSDEPIWLLKVNTEELSDFADMPTRSDEETREAARSISRAHGGTVANVVATRGADGALLITADGQEYSAKASVHPGLIASTVGCGDALMAGILHEYQQTHDWEKALVKGVAAASANAISRERGTFSLEDTEAYARTVIFDTPAPA